MNFEELLKHVGHRLKVEATTFIGEPTVIAIECEDCKKEITSYDELQKAEFDNLARFHGKKIECAAYGLKGEAPGYVAVESGGEVLLEFNRPDKAAAEEE